MVDHLASRRYSACLLLTLVAMVFCGCACGLAQGASIDIQLSAPQKPDFPSAWHAKANLIEITPGGNRSSLASLWFSASLQATRVERPGFTVISDFQNQVQYQISNGYCSRGRLGGSYSDLLAYARLSKYVGSARVDGTNANLWAYASGSQLFLKYWVYANDAQSPIRVLSLTGSYGTQLDFYAFSQGASPADFAPPKNCLSVAKPLLSGGEEAGGDLPFPQDFDHVLLALMPALSE
ncbi:hypothetical protein QOT17_020072 [Balamuthia mandrillaris]